MESSGHSRWFERFLQELGFELWIGDPAEIRTKRVRKQKTDRQDAQLILQLMLSAILLKGLPLIRQQAERMWLTAWIALYRSFLPHSSSNSFLAYGF